jgi:hypothetical protein
MPETGHGCDEAITCPARSAPVALDEHDAAHWSGGAGYAGQQLDELRPAAASIVVHTIDDIPDPHLALRHAGLR